MTYFSKFPLTTYTVDKVQSVVKNIFVRSGFTTEYTRVTDMYTTMTVSDGDTPESIALSLYGSPNYHWVVLIFNEIHDPLFEWPLNSAELEKLCIDNYGSNIHSLRYYTKDGNVVGHVNTYSSDVPWVEPPVPNVIGAIGVSFFEHEEKVNDAKREIRLLRPELLGDFATQFEESLNG